MSTTQLFALKVVSDVGEKRSKLKSTSELKMNSKMNIKINIKMNIKMKKRVNTLQLSFSQAAIALGFIALLLSGSPVFAGAPTSFALSSPDFVEGGTIPDAQVYSGFGCSGKNISPALVWTTPPKGTVSFAVTAYDPDAPTGSGWWHWLVFNLDKDTRKLKAGAGAIDSKLLPKGAVMGRTDYDEMAYGGPCPPSGKPHRYVFKVYALSTVLSLKGDSSPAKIGFYLNQNKLAEAQLIGTYGR